MSTEAPTPERFEAHRAATVVTEDGVIYLDNVPVVVGDRVEVLILHKSTASKEAKPLQALYPLRGKTPYRSGDVINPVLEDDWESWL